jgi:diguanylate cyclase (GGDEF)-like protein
MQAQGHLAGDLLLVRTTEILTRSSRRSDHLGRLGTDQLAVLLPRTDLGRGLVVARRVLARSLADARASERTRPGSTVALPRLSVALGHLTAPHSVSELLEATEAALQRARRAGGGVVETTRAEDSAAPEVGIRSA